jgi:hypothetical protein
VGEPARSLLAVMRHGGEEALSEAQQVDDVHQRCDDAIWLNDPSVDFDPLTATDDVRPPNDVF